MIEEAIRKAEACCQDGRYRDAEEIYTDLLKELDVTDEASLAPDRKIQLALVYNNLGHSKYLQVDFEDALQDYNHAIYLDPTLAVAYYNRGMVNYRLCAAMPQESGERQGMCKRARGDLQEAVRLDPENAAFKEGLDNCHDVPGGSWKCFLENS